LNHANIYRLEYHVRRPVHAQCAPFPPITPAKPMQEKSELREVLLAARKAVSPDLRAIWDAAIGVQVHAWLAAHPAQVIGVYWPIRGEPDLHGVYHELAATGVRLALPVVAGRNRPLAFAAWTPGDALTQDTWGVPIPAQCTLVQPDVLMVPCVGFNVQRVRLGYGGGFYDRTLAQMPRPAAIGIAYSCALADFTAEAHDTVLDVVLTETSCITEY
jgi:5-formyltetrahydrofolate cyclo-ligase